jgi:serine/threonine-protein kinase
VTGPRLVAAPAGRLFPRPDARLTRHAMPAPTTTDQLFDHLRKSGLVPAGQLDALLAQLPHGERPPAVLDRLVAAGLLTPFQADRIGAGKYKGFVLGGYVILDRIGGGGMGHVYLAEHAAMRRHVAVKVLAAGGADTVARQRFLREARAAAGLDHPNIIRVFDLRQERQVLYLVMEYVEGVSLHHLVARAGRLDIRAAAHYARQVALGLQHAHKAGLVHRDIKPGNLLLTRDGTVKILDLGLVRTEDEADSKLTSRLDKTILGTADYMAPEQAMDSSAVDIRADVYSLGATLYCLLAGHPMFPDGRTAQKLMWQQLRDPVPIKQVRLDVPDGLAAVVHKALRKDPGDRFQTPAELAAAVVPWATGPVPTPDPALLPPPPPRWLGAVPTGGAGPSLTVSCAVIDLPPSPLERRPDAVSPTLDERRQATPPRVFPPDRRTPLLLPQPLPRTVPLPADPAPPPPTPHWFWHAAKMAGLVALGFVTAILAVWVFEQMRR